MRTGGEGSLFFRYRQRGRCPCARILDPEGTHQGQTRHAVCSGFQGKSEFPFSSRLTDPDFSSLSTKKRIQQFGAETAFNRTLPFVEGDVLREILPYLIKTLGLSDAEVLSVDDARAREAEAGFTRSIIDGSEPGAPAFEYRNV